MMNEYFILLLGILLTVIPILREYKIKRSLFSWYILIIIVISLSLFYFSCKKIRQDKLQSEKAVKKNDSLFSKVDSIYQLKKSDSLKFSQFERKLLDTFKIGRDSINNNPVKIFNTNVKNAETVNIGND